MRVEYWNPNSQDLIESLDLDDDSTRCMKGQPNLQQRRRENLVLHLVSEANVTLANLDGDILVYLPGAEECNRVCKRLGTLRTASGCRKLLAVSTYDNLRLGELPRVFERAPEGCRKVVLTTRFAECSFQIDGITHVIDSGVLKENWYTCHVLCLHVIILSIILFL